MIGISATDVASGPGLVETMISSWGCRYMADALAWAVRG
jgi:hypothetical protein